MTTAALFHRRAGAAWLYRALTSSGEASSIQRSSYRSIGAAELALTSCFDFEFGNLACFAWPDEEQAQSKEQ